MRRGKDEAGCDQPATAGARCAVARDTVYCSNVRQEVGRRHVGGGRPAVACVLLMSRPLPSLFFTASESLTLCWLSRPTLASVERSRKASSLKPPPALASSVKVTASSRS